MSKILVNNFTTRYIIGLTLLTFVLRTNDPKFEQFPFRIGGQVELSIVSSLSPRLDRKSIEISHAAWLTQSFINRRKQMHKYRSSAISHLRFLVRRSVGFRWNAIPLIDSHPSGGSWMKFLTDAGIRDERVPIALMLIQEASRCLARACNARGKKINKK